MSVIGIVLLISGSIFAIGVGIMLHYFFKVLAKIHDWEE
jgi:hypothetical protein